MEMQIDVFILHQVGIYSALQTGAIEKKYEREDVNFNLGCCKLSLFLRTSKWF